MKPEIINPFKAAMNNPDHFVKIIELVPGPGSWEDEQNIIIELAKELAHRKIFDAFSLTHSPGGRPSILPVPIAQEIKKLGIEPLVHFTCKSDSRNSLMNTLYAMERMEIFNLLVMTGDHPQTGYSGRSMPVFDLDSVQLLKLINEMNHGSRCCMNRKQLQSTDFFPGAAMSPFKQTEAENMIQMYKLIKKVQAGAQFIIMQLGYDVRKFHEALMLKEKCNIKVPFIGNVYCLSSGAAGMMNKNLIPGCVVTDEFYAQIEKVDKNLPPEAKKIARRDVKEAWKMRSAKLYAVLRWVLKFDGVHIGGHGLSAQDYLDIDRWGTELEPEAEKFVKEFDFPMKKGFYFFEKNAETGLNLPIETPLEKPDKPELMYRVFKVFHSQIFEPGKPIFNLMRGVYSVTEYFPKWKKVLRKIEHISKVIMFECRDCGDCALLDTAGLCPMSQCPKHQRNGACGGSRDGWCELYPNEKKCIWVKIYDRLKADDEQHDLSCMYVPPPDWTLYNHDSWESFFKGDSYSAKREGIKPFVVDMTKLSLKSIVRFFVKNKKRKKS